MEEKIHELLSRLSGILHWLGKYHESKVLNALSVFLIENKIDYPDQLNQWNNPTVYKLREENRELKGTIRNAATQEDESDGIDIITTYYEENIK